MAAITRMRGTADWLPDRLPALRAATALGLVVAARYGYQEIATPMVEPTELFARGVGETTDIVSREMYTFPDRGGRSLTLRPEGTAPVLRAYGEAALHQGPRPLRLSYAGPMFRYDRPGKGRYRQFHQFGVEAVGDAAPELDAEVIAVAWEWLGAVGLVGTSLQLNSIGDGACRPAYRQALVEHLRPSADRLSELDRQRLERNPLRLLDSKDPDTLALLAGMPEVGEFLCAGCREALERVADTLDAYGIPYQRNPQLVRGLDYYQRTTFEIWHASLEGAQNALCGGGRYDGLSELLGYPPAPGVGFAAGLERIVALAAAPAAAVPAPVAVLTLAAAAVPAAVRLSQQLRRAGSAVTADLGPRSVKAKMRAADALGARVVCLLAAGEVDGDTVAVRDLRSGAQRSVAMAEVPQAVAAVLAGTGAGA